MSTASPASSTSTTSTTKCPSFSRVPVLPRLRVAKNLFWERLFVYLNSPSDKDGGEDLMKALVGSEETMGEILCCAQFDEFFKGALELVDETKSPPDMKGLGFGKASAALTLVGVSQLRVSNVFAKFGIDTSKAVEQLTTRAEKWTLAAKDVVATGDQKESKVITLTLQALQKLWYDPWSLLKTEREALQALAENKPGTKDFFQTLFIYKLSSMLVRNGITAHTGAAPFLAICRGDSLPSTVATSVGSGTTAIATIKAASTPPLPVIAGCGDGKEIQDQNAHIWLFKESPKTSAKDGIFVDQKRLKLGKTSFVRWEVIKTFLWQATHALLCFARLGVKIRVKKGTDARNPDNILEHFRCFCCAAPVGFWEYQVGTVPVYPMNLGKVFMLSNLGILAFDEFKNGNPSLRTWDFIEDLIAALEALRKAEEIAYTTAFPAPVVPKALPKSLESGRTFLPTPTARNLEALAPPTQYTQISLWLTEFKTQLATERKGITLGVSGSSEAAHGALLASLEKLLTTSALWKSWLHEPHGPGLSPASRIRLFNFRWDKNFLLRFPESYKTLFPAKFIDTKSALISFDRLKTDRDPLLTSAFASLHPYLQWTGSTSLLSLEATFLNFLASNEQNLEPITDQVSVSSKMIAVRSQLGATGKQFLEELKKFDDLPIPTDLLGRGTGTGTMSAFGAFPGLSLTPGASKSTGLTPEAELARSLELLVLELERLQTLNPLKRLLYNMIHQAYASNDTGLTGIFSRVLKCNSGDEVSCFLQALELSYIVRRMKKLGMTGLLSPFDMPTDDFINLASSQLLTGMSAGSMATASSTGSSSGSGSTGSKLLTQLTTPILDSSPLSPALQHIRRKIVGLLAQYMGMDESQLVQILGIVYRHNLKTGTSESEKKVLPFIARFLVGLLTEKKALAEKVQYLEEQDERYRTQTQQEREKVKQHYVIPVRNFEPLVR